MKTIYGEDTPGLEDGMVIFNEATLYIETLKKFRRQFFSIVTNKINKYGAMNYDYCFQIQTCWKWEMEGWAKKSTDPILASGLPWKCVNFVKFLKKILVHFSAIYIVIIILINLQFDQAPLLIGCDIRSVSKETLSIMGNKEVIDVNQDSLGVQARKIRSKTGLEVCFNNLFFFFNLFNHFFFAYQYQCSCFQAFGKLR